MIATFIVFYLFLGVFALIGSMRGWAKELLIVFSVVLGLALIWVLENLVPVIRPLIASNPNIQYGVRITIIVSLTFFGYQSPKISRLAKAAERRDRIQDIMLGFVMGLVSGFFVIGTIWFYSDQAAYPGLAKYIVAPTGGMLDATQSIMSKLPPVWLGQGTNVIIAVVLAFIFVMVVFI
jgi:hypothetical protein